MLLRFKPIPSLMDQIEQAHSTQQHSIGDKILGSI